jgi:hypothetical protein
VPEAAKARAVWFFVTGARARWRQIGGWIETTTPPIGLHEVVVVDL